MPGPAGEEEPGGGADLAPGGAPEGRGRGQEPAGTLRTPGPETPATQAGGTQRVLIEGNVKVM